MESELSSKADFCMSQRFHGHFKECSSDIHIRMLYYSCIEFPETRCVHLEIEET